MTDPTALKVRQIAFAPGPGDKVRPGVILRVEPLFVLVAFGTGTYRPEFNPVTVEENSRWHRAFGRYLYKTTHFYRSNILAVRPDVVDPKRQVVPIDLWVRLNALLAEPGQPQ